MAFNVRNLTPISNNQKTGVVPSVWLYWNENNDTVTTNGFIPNNYGLSAKDQVIVIKNDGTNHAIYHVTVVGGKITLVLNA